MMARPRRLTALLPVLLLSATEVGMLWAVPSPQQHPASRVATAASLPANSSSAATEQQWVVAIDATSPPQEHWAARQLAQLLGQWLNCSPNSSLDILTPKAAQGRPALLVGARAAAAAAPPGSLRALGPEAFWCHSSSVSTTAPQVFLSGGIDSTSVAEPRGTINGVFEYLRLCGFRWWTPNATALPRSKSSSSSSSTAAALPALPGCNGVTRPSISRSRKISSPNLHTLTMPNCEITSQLLIATVLTLCLCFCLSS